MNYELIKELKDNGFPLIELAPKAVSGRESCIFCGSPFIQIDERWFMVPVLSQLIEAQGDSFDYIKKTVDGWHGRAGTYVIDDVDIETVVAKLWLALNKRDENSI